MPATYKPSQQGSVSMPDTYKPSQQGSISMPDNPSQQGSVFIAVDQETMRISTSRHVSKRPANLMCDVMIYTRQVLPTNGLI
jgi:hypothetical protein